MDGRGLGKNQWDFLISVVDLLNHAHWLRICDNIKCQNVNQIIVWDYVHWNTMHQPDTNITLAASSSYLNIWIEIYENISVNPE